MNNYCTQQCIKAIAVWVNTRTVLHLIKYLVIRKVSAFKSATTLILTVRRNLSSVKGHPLQS